MNRSSIDLQLRGFIDRIQKGVPPAVSSQSVAILPYNDIVYHRTGDGNDIDWIKDPYLAGHSLPLTSDWLNLPKPSSYMADPLRAEQYGLNMQLEADDYYDRRFFYGKIHVYPSSGSTHYFQRKNWGLQFMLNHPTMPRNELLNESTNNNLELTKSQLDMLYSGLGAITVTGSNFLAFSFDGYWILFRHA